MASSRGIYNFGYDGVKFYGSSPRLNLRVTARSIIGHKYYNHDIVYSVKGEGGRVVARGNAELLNALYREVGDALEGYCRNEKKIKEREENQTRRN